MLCFALLLAIAGKMGVFSEIGCTAVFDLGALIFANTYISGILCSILAVIIIYIIQVHYSKRMLKKDVRCNEVIEDIYDGIERYLKIMDSVPKQEIKNEDDNYIARREKECKQWINFYEEKKLEIEMITLSLSCENNNLLIDSVQSCFFINLNFKLLNIINHIKNRLPNLRKGYPEMKKLYEKYKSDGDQLMYLGNRVQSYFIDLRFMSLYWKSLLDYLGYDPTYIKLFVKTYASQYDILDVLKEPKEMQYSKMKRIDKIVKRDIRRYKIQHFWDK